MSTIIAEYFVIRMVAIYVEVFVGLTSFEHRHDIGTTEPEGVKTSIEDRIELH